MKNSTPPVLYIPSISTSCRFADQKITTTFAVLLDNLPFHFPVVFISVLDEKNSAIIVEDIGDEAEEEKLQQPDNLDNVDIDIVDFIPEGERREIFYNEIWRIYIISIQSQISKMLVLKINLHVPLTTLEVYLVEVGKSMYTRRLDYN
jgi:hypothetical protein